MKLLQSIKNEVPIWIKCTSPNRFDGTGSQVLVAVLISLALLLIPGSAKVTLSDGIPYPQSPVITDLEWAPESSIIRMASGSDTWPITWADDGDLYTAYGDGNGFSPQVPGKLSLGFASVAGDPSNISATNIRSATGEQHGDGTSGKKASGMLMVDSVLYMWVRNADQNGKECQLASSQDHAQTWTWSTWSFEELGYCTLINFGQNYQGARDNFVYMVSHNNSSAYSPADSFVLTRVPKDQITNRSSYEFFTGLDINGDPLWSSDITERGAVFTHAGDSARSGISYNAPLGRYLWWQQIPDGGVDTRFSGGFGIYDAPEPWGPWTTVYFTQDWDVGPGETASFPTKWISSDGLTLYLVFSGDDSFSVRKATLTVAVQPSGCPTLPALSNQSQDLDSDGKCEDINGNNAIDFDDIVEFFQYLNTLPGQNLDELDFNDNSIEDMDDLVKLFNILVAART